MNSNAYSTMTNSIVCFADVLGFRDMIKQYCQAGKGNELLHQFRCAMEYNIFLVRTIDIISKLKTFTDNIVIGWPITTGCSEGILEIGNLIKKIAEFQLQLVFKNFFLRGAIVSGLHYMQGNVVFGPALLKAVELEKNVAIYPRIILSESVSNLVQHDKDYPDYCKGKNYIDLYLLTDSDGCYFINYLADIQWFIQYSGRADYNKACKLLLVHKHLIEDNLNKYREKPSIYSKYHWSLRYHNYFCQKYMDGKKELLLNTGEFSPVRID